MRLLKTRLFALAIVALALLLGGALAPANAQSADATVKADMSACTQSNDGMACQRAYLGLYEQMKGKSGAQAEADWPDLLTIADTGCAAANRYLCAEVAGSYRRGALGRATDKPLAFSFYTKACDLDNASGCAQLGIMLEQGEGAARDRLAAEPLYRKSCKLGSSLGCQYLAGWLLITRIYTEPAPSVSIATLESKCADTNLDGPSCVELGIAYFRGGRVTKDNQRGNRYWSMACARVAYAPGCFYRSANDLRVADMKDKTSSKIRTAILTLLRGCDLGDVQSCEFAVVAGQKYAWDDENLVAQGMYGRCLDKPSVEDCTIAGRAFRSHYFPDNPIKAEAAPGKAMRALMTACREFNVACVDVANIYLGEERFTAASVNLALGVLVSACGKGDNAACLRYNEVVAEKGGVTGSYIDPMLNDDQRFLLARFDIESGDTQRGRETMQWLACMGHTHAQLFLAYAYESGLDVAPRAEPGKVRELPYTLMNKRVMIYELFDEAAKKGVPEAAMKAAVIKYYEDDHTGSDSYETAIYRAQYLGAAGANEFAAAVITRNKARTDAQIAAIQEMNRQNIQSRDNMDRQTVQSAWDQYYKRQEERKEAAGGEVCGTVYGEGNSTYRTCMSRDTAMKYYRGNF
jgi:TPR repeat protein